MTLPVRPTRCSKRESIITGSYTLCRNRWSESGLYWQVFATSRKSRRGALPRQ